MAFKNSTWEYSEKVIEGSQPIEFGERYLFIENAAFDDVKKEYKIFVKDLGNKATFSLSYWLTSLDQATNQIIDNELSIGTLNSLGEALAGVNIGVPNPQDIIGGVVFANVKESKPNANGKTYARVYKFEPVPEDMAVFATIDQFYVGAPPE